MRSPVMAAPGTVLNVCRHRHSIPHPHTTVLTVLRMWIATPWTRSRLAQAQAATGRGKRVPALTAQWWLIPLVAKRQLAATGSPPPRLVPRVSRTRPHTRPRMRPRMRRIMVRLGHATRLPTPHPTPHFTVPPAYTC